MKQLVIALLPIILLLWLTMILCLGFVRGSLVMLISLILTALMCAWIYFVCNHFDK